MFLNSIITRNKALIESAVLLHQRGDIPANSYVIDIDSVYKNALLLQSEAEKHKLKIFAMTKQIGRNPVALHAMQKAGIKDCVAVDMPCARAAYHNGLSIGHIGHLVQVPYHETLAALRMKPKYWTVFSLEKARAISKFIQRDQRQNILLRLHAAGDTFYRGHEGGFAIDEMLTARDAINNLPGLHVSGITTFPAHLFDEQKHEVVATNNLRTLEKAATILANEGMKDIEINAPGTTSSMLFHRLAALGVTQVEPGHGFTGTTPLNAIDELVEIPAMVYVSEVSHIHAGAAYFFGGGLYIDPVFSDYTVKACVGSCPADALARTIPCEIPSPAAIDYYGILAQEQQVKEGDSVVLGFRAQAFVTRAYVVPVSGIGTDTPKAEGVYSSDGRSIGWPEW